MVGGLLFSSFHSWMSAWAISANLFYHDRTPIYDLLTPKVIEDLRTYVRLGYQSIVYPLMSSQDNKTGCMVINISLTSLFYGWDYMLFNGVIGGFEIIFPNTESN